MMSIFPEKRKQQDTVTPANAGVQPEASGRDALDSGVRWNDKDEASSKQHRFDKFARRLAASMIEAIRVSLAVFSSPDKDRWPATRLLDYLKGAEGLAREMLREIAMKIFISPAVFRKRSKQGEVMPTAKEAETAPCFRLGVKAKKDNSPGTDDDPHKQSAGADAPSYAQRSEETASSIFQQRLNALNDVLAHPGKHGARMARALYREQHGKGQRLLAKSPNDVLLDKIARALFVSDRAELQLLHADVMAHDTS